MASAHGCEAKMNADAAAAVMNGHVSRSSPAHLRARFSCLVLLSTAEPRWAFSVQCFGTQQARHRAGEDRCPPGATTPQGRNQSFRWCCSRCHRSCHYLNQERLAEGASCGCITGRMERGLSSAYCVFRGIPSSWTAFISIEEQSFRERT